MQHEELVVMVLGLTESQSPKTMQNALWTICNAIQGSKVEDRKALLDKYQDDLICILCDSLVTMAENCKDIFLEIMDALDKLLLLDA